jgi:hypothetical protein
MRQKRSELALLVGLMVLMGSATVQAISLGFVPPSQDVVRGSAVSVALVIADLGTDTVGSFDVVVSFDPAILSLDLVDVALGPFLGEPGLEAVTDVRFVPGIPERTFLNVFEVSLLLPAELETLQPSSFPLATFTFDTLRVGTSLLDITLNALGDANGDPLALSAPPRPSAITVQQEVTAIPEPSTWLLLAIGYVGLLGYGWRRHQRVA